MAEEIKSVMSASDVRHLARLARIALTDDEVATFGQQLAEVIDYNVSLLSEVNVTGVAPTSQTTGLTNSWRLDEPQPSQTAEVALANAPRQRQNQFVVKKVLGEA